MPPRKQTPEEQQEELRATLENFTTTLRETLLHAVETALTTVIQRQQQPQDNAANQPREENDTDEDLAKNLFANEEPRNI
ncbi:BnaC03g15960D [Brassica napus]|uniref:BnaC03g15960D protein n=1 Tax=Brassica napus TaxID=3708 RepID=A0A078H727_BRANA|nr:BnaC03g15960D [Brassica napus]